MANADTFALVSDVGMGLAVAGAAVGTVLLVLGLSASAESGQQAVVAPWLSPEDAGIVTRARF